MFKIISMEIKKSVSKPGVFILAVLLAIILVLGVFIYNPTEYDTDTNEISGSSFDEIYNKFINSTGFKVNADNTINETVELVESYTINNVSYQEYIQTLQTNLKAAVTNYAESGNDASTKDRISQKRDEVGIALTSLYDNLEKGIELGKRDCFPILISNSAYEEFTSCYTDGLEFILTEVKKENVADRCSDFTKQYVSKLDSLIGGLLFPKLSKEMLSQYSSDTEDSNLFQVKQRLNLIVQDIDSLIEEAAGDPTETQTNRMRDLCKKYIDTANTYKNLVDYVLLSNAFSYTSTSKQINMRFLSDYDKFNVNTNFIRYSYIFNHNLTENDFAHPLAIGTTSNSQKNGYDYAYYILKLFSFVIMAYAVMSACHTIAGEIKEGSMRYLAIRPVNRTKILFGKLLAIMLMSTIFAIFSTIIAMIVGGVVYGLESATILTIFNGSKAITLHPLVMLILYVISMLIEVSIYVSIAMLLSCLIKSDIVSLTIMLLVYLINILLPTFVANPTSWLAFYPFSHISLYSLFGSSIYANSDNILNAILSAKVFTNTSLWLSLIIILLIDIVVNIVSTRIFNKKEL